MYRYNFYFHAQIPCTVLTAVAHYFFLCAFFWMLMEGVVLYFMFISVFHCMAGRVPIYYFVSYLCPAVIVCVTIAIAQYSETIGSWEIYTKTADDQ